MKKTVALYGSAAALLVAAVAISIWAHRPSAPPELVAIEEPPPPPPVPNVPAPIAGRGTAQIGDLVQLDAALSNDFIANAGDGELFLRMKLQAKDVAGARAPMALAIVIDRSGSMAGEKMERAREAARQLVERLDDADQVTVISYSTDYTVDVPLTALRGADRARIARIIDQIYDGGGTNLSGGLEAGLGELRRAQGQGTATRLILVSDGNANQGITDPRALAKIAQEARQRGSSVSTVGLGLDFNEDVMTMIADSGGGSYHYVRDASAIAGVLDDEFKGLAALAARQVEVGLDLGEGVVVKEVYGYRTESRRGRLTIPVGDLASGETRQVVVRFAVAPGGSPELGVTDLSLAYVPASGEVTREFHAALTVGTTNDVDLIQKSERRDVIETAEAIFAAEARHEAATAFQAGNKSGAVKRLDAQIGRTRAKATALHSESLFKHVKELEQAAEDLRATDASTDEGKDLVKREKYRARQVFVY